MSVAAIALADDTHRAPSNHWAFQPLQRHVIPPSTDHRARSTVDAFILHALDAHGLSQMPAAHRRTLIRRVTYDLTGLPAPPDAVDAFVHDPSPDAYERLIDRLLAAPAYGERWAQHWLDIVRFAETDGFEHDLVRPNAWRYRDWVIAALNDDMPYDRFVHCQIAGDELDGDHAAGAQTDPRPSDHSTTLRLPGVATGFLLCGPDMPDINLQDERRHNVLNEMTSAVGSVFLGLQLGCAQCHDHKYDPITIADFYRMRAFFDPADFFEESPLATVEQLAERERLEAPLKAERERIGNEFKRFDAIAHERLNKDPQVRITRDELLSALSETEREEFKQLLDEQKRAGAGSLRPLPMARMLREKGGKPRTSHVMTRGDFRQPGPRVQPAFPPVANPWNDPVQVAESAAPSSGRRSALAHWLTRPDHALTTRVIVNRIWQFHFGEGLVRSPNDFGTMGERPSHPELLDWLAGHFTRPVADGGCGWSLKRLHKLLLTSATYMQASRPTEPGWSADQRAAALVAWNQSRAQDPENRLLARMHRIRLDGEAIRDAMLAASDQLHQDRGGPGVRPPLPDELVATLLKNQWNVSPDETDHRRRSIYVFVRRNLRYPLFDVFDRPDTNASCPQRPRSTTAPQSLALLNSELALTAARELAGYVLRHAAEQSLDPVALAFARTLQRPPLADEHRAATLFLDNQTTRLRQERRTPTELAVPAAMPADSDPFRAAALTDLCLALFNSNEFIYLD